MEFFPRSHSAAGGSEASGEARDLSPGSASVVLVPRVLRRPSLGRRWVLESTLLSWIDSLDPNVVAAPRELLAHRVLGEADAESSRDQVPTKLVIVFESPGTVVWDEALPRLVDAGIPFALCIATAWVGRSYGGANGHALNWRQLTELASLRIDLGSCGHWDLDDERRTPEESFRELAVSYREIQHRLGVEPWLLRHSVPQVTARESTLAREVGYRVGLCAEGGARGVEDSLRYVAYRPRPWHGASAWTGRANKRWMKAESSRARILDFSGRSRWSRRSTAR